MTPTTLPPTELDYVPGRSIIPADAFGISPSQLSVFFSKPHLWYASELLDQNDFNGNTSSVIGTIVHYCARSYARAQSVNDQHIYSYLAKTCTPSHYELVMAAYSQDKSTIDELLIEHNERTDLDIEYILQQFRPMANALMKFLKQIGLPQRTEELISAEVLPGYYACGSCDAVIGDRRVIDYKTTSALSAPTSIPYEYKLQLLTYAWIYKQAGLPIDAITIIWITHNQVGRFGKTGKPLEDYPSTVTQCTESVSESDFAFIESLLKLVAESVQLSVEHPEYRHIIWKDYRLK